MNKPAVAIVALVALGGASAWIASRRNSPPEVAFVRATRETLVSTLTTNAKIEPLDYSMVRVDIEGTLTHVQVESGQAVAKGTLLATLDVSPIRMELADAEALIAQARAELVLYERGGSGAALAQIDSGLTKARLGLEIARREAASVERLVANSAATKHELETALDRVRQFEVEVRGLAQKRETLLPDGGREAAEARLQKAQAAAALARARIEQGIIRAPIAGVVYSVAVKAGAFLRPGDLVAEIGTLDRLRAVLYVDEPELGRVGKGMAVTITWDATPGRSWSGTVEKLPSQIVALGTRQVGEVICHIDNRDGLLQPGANVNAEVRSAVAEAAVTIPKEGIRRDGDRIGVLLLDGEKIAWRAVRLGVSGVTRVQIVDGLKEGDAVALPSDRPLRDGDSVTAVFPR